MGTEKSETDIMNEKKSPPAQARRRKPRRHRSQPRMHEITFCVECEEAIPKHAHVCFHCGQKQPLAEGALQVYFCQKCGRDFPARAMACHHCGHLNPLHPYLRGQIAG